MQSLTDYININHTNICNDFCMEILLSYDKECNDFIISQDLAEKYLVSQKKTTLKKILEMNKMIENIDFVIIDDAITLHICAFEMLLSLTKSKFLYQLIKIKQSLINYYKCNVNYITNRELDVNKDLTTNRELDVNKDLTTNRELDVNKDLTTNRELDVNKEVILDKLNFISNQLNNITNINTNIFNKLNTDLSVNDKNIVNIINKLDIEMENKIKNENNIEIIIDKLSNITELSSHVMKMNNRVRV